MTDLYLEDLSAGHEYLSRARTLTDTDLVLFASLTWLTEPLFFVDEAARSSGFASRIMPGPLVLSYALGLAQEVFSASARGLLSIEEVRFRAPAYAGVTIRTRTTIADVRKSNSRPGVGIVSVSDEVLGGDSAVMTFSRKLFIAERSPDRS